MRNLVSVKKLIINQAQKKKTDKIAQTQAKMKPKLISLVVQPRL